MVPTKIIYAWWSPDYVKAKYCWGADFWGTRVVNAINPESEEMYLLYHMPIINYVLVLISREMLQDCIVFNVL